MLRNYLIGQFRNLVRNKGLTFISLASLAVGMACCLAIAAWVESELSYDRFHRNGDRLFRVWTEWNDETETRRSSLTTELLGPALEEGAPEVVRTARFLDRGKQYIRYGEQSHFSEEMAIADPAFLEMFTFPLVRGDIHTALAERFSVVISESMARKYFGDRDPLGEVLNINRRDFTVSAVIADVPFNSHLKFDCLAPFDSRSDQLANITRRWDVSVYYTYVQLHQAADVATVSDKATAIQTLNMPESKYSFALDLQPITRIHLHHEIVDYLEGHGEILYVYLFSSLAVLLLIVAGINYTNLATARATERAREIGLRKAIGASRVNLALQFFGEALISTIAAGLLAVVLVEAFLPLVSDWSGIQLQFDPLLDPTMLLIMLAVVVFTAAVAGTYPACVLSAYKPVRALTGRLDSKPSGVLLRRLLVVTQFAAAIILIVGTCAIQSQLSYIRDKELGFDKNNLFYLDMRAKFREHYFSVKEELLSDPSIVSVTSGRPPVEGFNSAFNLSVDGRQIPDDIMVGRSPVDANYVETMGMEIVEGRSFLAEEGLGIRDGFVLNETAMAALGSEVGLGSRITFSGHDQDLETVAFEGNILGVVKDFHNRPLQSRITPMIMYYSPDELYDLCVRTAPGMEQQAISAVKRLWEKYSPDYAFEYHFVDNTIDEFYRTETRLEEMFNVFTVLAVLISCLGLIGLASHAANRKVREIGIRRVLGATSGSIIKLMSAEFLTLVTVSSVFAVPAGWYIINKWLEQFAYRVEIGWELFALSVMAAMLLAMATVSFQTVRAVRANPVDSLRYE